MLYLLTKLIAKISFLAVYRKVYIINEDNVPGDRAALITCNHPNGFVEPLVIGGYIPHKIYFLVRGDVFRKKLARYLLNAIHCIPIFRFRDGFASMRKNNDSINEALEALSRKKPLIIFAEGSTQQVRYVRPIQKGSIRLAFDTLQNAPESNPCIIPSFIHFTDPQFYRSEVIMEYGAPINIVDYGELYETHKAKAIKKLLDDVNSAMQELSIMVDPAIETKDADTVFEIARSTVREKNIFPIIQKVKNSPNRDAERNAGRHFSRMDEGSRSLLISEITDLKKQSDSAGINYEQLSGRTRSNYMNLMMLIIGFIPFLLGYIFNVLPITLARYFSKNKVKKIEFKAVMKLIPFLSLYPPYLLILGSILAFASWKSVLFVFLIPILGWYSFVYKAQFKEFLANRNYKNLNTESRDIMQKAYRNILAKLSII